MKRQYKIKSAVLLVQNNGKCSSVVAELIRCEECLCSIAAWSCGGTARTALAQAKKYLKTITQEELLEALI